METISQTSQYDWKLKSVINLFIIVYLSIIVYYYLSMIVTCSDIYFIFGNLPEAKHSCSFLKIK